MDTRIGGREAPLGSLVHLNVCFDEPLTPEDRWEPDLDPREWFTRPAEHLPSTTIPIGPQTVVVAGDDSGPPARVIAETANWPLLAEPTSGSRTGTHAVRTYRLLLGGMRPPAAHEPVP